MRILRACRGFTLTELVIIIIIVGIMAAVAMPRFFGREFDERGFRDGVKAAIQHARHMATASRRFVCVTNTGGVGAAASVTLTMDTRVPEGNEANAVACASGGSTVTVALPGGLRGCAANAVCAPTGIALGGDSVIFDPLGRLVSAAKAVGVAATITVQSDPTLTITVQPETGWVQ